ncbi:protein C-ets-2-like [Heptranchias perlo]|uniref:protein C-ets-2-like n=1 Tax=Heptranchias perlo TaxID=212740 RepID=UPI003559A9CB
MSDDLQESSVRNFPRPILQVPMSDDLQESSVRNFPRPILQRQDAIDVCSLTSQTSDYFSIEDEESLSGEAEYLAEAPELVDKEEPTLTAGNKAGLSDGLKATYREFREKRKQLGIERDPRLWSDRDVIEWLVWAQSAFRLGTLDLERFGTPGWTLWERGKGHFLELVPESGAEMLWEHLEHLVRDCQETDCLQTEQSEGSTQTGSTHRPQGQSSENQQCVPAPERHGRTMYPGDYGMSLSGTASGSEPNLNSWGEDDRPTREEAVRSSGGRATRNGARTRRA